MVSRPPDLVWEEMGRKRSELEMICETEETTIQMLTKNAKEEETTIQETTLLEARILRQEPTLEETHNI